MKLDNFIFKAASDLFEDSTHSSYRSKIGHKFEIQTRLSSCSIWCPKKSEILGLHFCANMNLDTQPAVLENCLKIIDLSWLKCLPCMKIAIVLIFTRSHWLRYYAVYSLLLHTITKQLHFSTCRTCKSEKKFGQFGSAATLFAKFRTGTRKSLSDFWPPLLERPIKFVFDCGHLQWHVHNDRGNPLIMRLLIT